MEWRDHTIAWFKERGIRGLSPMRCKEYLEKEFANKPIGSDGNEYKAQNVLSSNRGIMTRDRNDATRCDVLLVNFLGATRPSIGTCMEIAWADLSRIPIVCAMEAEGNPHYHGMVLEAIGYRVETLEEARLICHTIIAP